MWDNSPYYIFAYDNTRCKFVRAPFHFHIHILVPTRVTYVANIWRTAKFFSIKSSLLSLVGGFSPSTISRSHQIYYSSRANIQFSPLFHFVENFFDLLQFFVMKAREKMMEEIKDAECIVLFFFPLRKTYTLHFSFGFGLRLLPRIIPAAAFFYDENDDHVRSSFVCIFRSSVLSPQICISESY